MHFVTRLKSSFRDFPEPQISMAIASLKKLKALDVPCFLLCRDEEDRSPVVPRLAQLTEISITIHGDMIGDLGCLTLIEHLRLRVICSSSERTLDEALQYMMRLQTLHVSCTYSFQRVRDSRSTETTKLSSGCLSDKQQLREITLCAVDVDKNFFSELSAMTQLTKLKFVTLDRRPFSRSFFSHVNLLSNLVELELQFGRHSDIFEILSPRNLQKLKRLTVSGTEDQVSELRHKFKHAEHGVAINREKSGWCSRFVV